MPSTNSGGCRPPIPEKIVHFAGNPEWVDDIKWNRKTKLVRSNKLCQDNLQKTIRRPHGTKGTDHEKDQRNIAPEMGVGTQRSTNRRELEDCTQHRRGICKNAQNAQDWTGLKQKT